MRPSLHSLSWPVLLTAALAAGGAIASSHTWSVAAPANSPVTSPVTSPAKPTPAANSEASKLRWAPPVLDNPVTLTVGQGYTSKNLKDGQDYLVRLPAEKQVGGLALKGGRNIVLIGGHITLQPGADNQSQQRAIYVKDSTGTVHIEGVEIDNSGGSEFDGIAVAAPEAIIQIENCRITGLSGSYKTLHADILQPWGGAREIRIDRLTGSSSYQGLQIPPDRATIGAAHLRNINLSHINPPTGRPGFLLWLTTGNNTCNTYPMSLVKVYVVGRAGEPAGQSVWPPLKAPAAISACAAVETADGIRWPGLPGIDGKVLAGAPPRGDFVPEGVAGTRYVSPGYEAPQNQ